MRFYRSGTVDRNQRGFGVIELIIAVAITSLLGLGVTAATSQVFSHNMQGGTHVTAIKQVENAIHWVSRDTQMARSVTPDAGDSGFPLVLSWVEWDSTTHEVTYDFDGSVLKRSHSVNGGGPSEMMVARDINTDAQLTSCAFSEGVLTLRVTATVGGGSQASSETGMREIIARPSLE